jgi:hypothetical protein
MDQKREAREPRNDLPQSLELLACKLGADAGHAGQVAAGSGQAGHESTGDRVSHRGHDDRNRAGRILCRLRGRRQQGDDDVDVEESQFTGQGGGTVAAAIGGPPLDDDILTLDVSLLLQAVADRRLHGSGQLGAGQDADRGRPDGPLRLGGDGRGEKAASQRGYERPSIQ